MVRNSLKFSWRGIHFGLAIFSSIFLLIAAGTGVVLSFEPILHPKAIEGADNILLSDLIATLNAAYLEVFSIARDNYGNIKIEAIGEVSDGTFVINPFDGSEIKNVAGEHPVFDFCRDLHRSLFLKETGRFFVGLASLALLFLAGSGIFLLIKRAGNWKDFFSKIIVLDFYRDNHARFGRLFLIPIVVISLSATWLFIDRFFQSENKEATALPSQVISNENHFTKIKLGEVKELLFPISGDAEEFFELKLHQKTLLLNQENGALVSEVKQPLATILHDISFHWHTGEGLGSVYAILLLLSSFITIFFIYSGVKMSWSRFKKRPKNSFSLKEATHVILVGSETGHTIRFANEVHKSFLDKGIKSFLCPMNKMEEASQMEQLLIFTSTYGDGDAPSNADNFLRKVDNGLFDKKQFYYSVLGFGSKSYDNYCQFAFDVANSLKNLPLASEVTETKTVNDISIPEFLDWLKAWKKETKLELNVNLKSLEPIRNSSTLPFKIISRKESLNPNDDTFLLEIEIPPNAKIANSGDLLGVYSPESNIERYYSIAHIKSTNRIVLSIKRTGLCSSYLGGLNAGDVIQAYIKPNENFYPDPNAGKVLLIGNGTGIAPFLGFIENNTANEVTLLWGGQKKASFELYQSLINDFGELKGCHLAFSRELPKTYVQDIVLQNKENVANTVKVGGQIMLCGSLKMREGVLTNLENILCEFGLPSIKELIAKGRILSDCY
ncbi:sulfite reductase (NADPH) flavoprotein alpha-component [Spirosomataceae bacterium TFI 002]|nr:sulfite reductase (NADPH) flavoprotein alpha-component [Spirosomataceae bacterium TFI 002]